MGTPTADDLNPHYLKETNPEGPYTLPLWNQVPKDHPYNGCEGPSSIIVVHMDPLGKARKGKFGYIPCHG